MDALWTPFRVMDEESERKLALATLCRNKCSQMDLTNHLTGFLALQKLPQPHRDNLKRMGYGAMSGTTPQNNKNVSKTPLDFSVGGHASEKFAVDNGARGKLPVTPAEWSPKPLANSCVLW